jgi:signal transduction histidine kinase
MLLLHVRDDGPGLPSDAGVLSEGIGLSNTRERLQVLYGAEYRFELRNLEGGGLEVTLGIPIDRATLELGESRAEENTWTEYAP